MMTTSADSATMPTPGSHRAADARRLTGPGRFSLGLARLAIGLMFLWTFVDALVGLDYPSNRSWLDGDSPAGPLLKAADGPLSTYYHDVANSAWTDWVLMVGLAFAGITLTLGVLVRLGALYGGLILLVIQGALLPPLDSSMTLGGPDGGTVTLPAAAVRAVDIPFLPLPLVLALVLLGLVLARAENTLGFGKRWGNVVGKVPFLK